MRSLLRAVHSPSAVPFAVSFAFVLACGSPVPPVAPASATAGSSPPAATTPAPAASAAPLPPPERLKDSANRATASGATFTVPAGWSIQSNGTISILVGPEPDIGLAIVDAGSRSAEEAVVAAWKALRPDFKRPIHLATPFPGRDGWDEGVGFEYETSPDEKLALGGLALIYRSSAAVSIAASRRRSALASARTPTTSRRSWTPAMTASRSAARMCASLPFSAVASGDS